jgi:hypothetical protein
MKKRTLLALTLFALFPLLALQGRAAAEEAKPDLAKAKQHFKTGQGFFKQEKWAEAIAEYKKAYAISKDGLALGQAAVAYEKAGDYEGALEAIKIYRDALDEKERPNIDPMIQKFEKAIAEHKSKKLVIPGETAPPAEGSEVSTLGQRSDSDKTQPAASQPVEAPKKKRERFYTWIVAGGAAALALSGLVVGLNAQSKYDELSDLCKPNCSSSEVDSVKTRALVADVLFGAAIAAGITAGVLYFLEGRAATQSDKSSEEGEKTTRKRIRFAPTLGRGSYGLSAGYQF